MCHRSSLPCSREISRHDKHQMKPHNHTTTRRMARYTFLYRCELFRHFRHFRHWTKNTWVRGEPRVLASGAGRAWRASAAASVALVAFLLAPRRHPHRRNSTVLLRRSPPTMPKPHRKIASSGPRGISKNRRRQANTAPPVQQGTRDLVTHSLHTLVTHARYTRSLHTMVSSYS